MWKVSIHYLQNWQNYAAFSHGNLAPEVWSQIVSAFPRKRKRRTNIFEYRVKCLECLPSPFTYSCQTICKTRDSFFNWTCEKLSHVFSSATFNTETVLGFRWGFQTSYVAPQTRYLHSIQIWRVIRWPLFLFKHLRTVFVEALLRDKCNAHRAPCILLNLPLHLAAVGCTLQWNKKLSWCWQTSATRLEVNQGHQT